MDEWELIKREVKRIFESIPNIEAAALISLEGLPIASLSLERTDSMRFAAMAAAIFSIGEHTVLEANRGNLKKIVIMGDDKSIHVIPAGKIAILVLLTGNLRLGDEIGSKFFPSHFPRSDSDGGGAAGLGLSEFF